MSQEQEDTEENSSEPPGASILSEARKRSLANLRPPWAPGQSGNPSGLSADGLPSKEKALQRHAERLLAHPNAKGQTWAYRIVRRWIADAAAGSDAARRDLLERYWPVVKDDPNAGRIVLEGLKLELAPGKASLTMVSTSTTDGGPGGEQSDAKSSREESYGGGAPEQPSQSISLQSTPLVLEPPKESSGVSGSLLGLELPGVSMPQSVQGLGGGDAAAGDWSKVGSGGLESV